MRTHISEWRGSKAGGAGWKPGEIPRKTLTLNGPLFGEQIRPTRVCGFILVSLPLAGPRVHSMLIRLLDNAPIGATPGEGTMSSRSEVRSLSVGVHHRWEPRRIFGFVSMADLTAYIDESGTHGGSPLTIMAAFIGYAERWDEFDQHWRTILTDKNLEYIHAIELAHGNGQFRDKVKWPGNLRKI